GFLYVRGKEWYWAMEEDGDVIEGGINEVVDMRGWEVRKGVGLLNK
ncbi:DNA polymerase beta superfamily protein, partial [Bacillus pumilus]